jgi:structural maintenance of chromosome 4
MSETPEIDKRGRLVIKEIILQDFKSYGGRRVIGPFHECFSAIIGPNGSGKSNVIDALMFVFGKKAKKIRLSKLSELIHNPQKGGQKPSSARVEVIFQEIVDLSPGQFTAVPGSELVVAREVSSNNSSKYIVNGRSSNWTDVTALFSSKGIDLEHNRFLILQGEVEQIAMMKPIGDGQHDEGLLEYLEDLIGSNQFIEAITEKTKEFTELSDQRNEHIHRVKQAEKEKDALEGPRQEAELYVKAATELLEARCTLAMIQRHQLDVKIEEARAEVNEAALQLDQVAEEIQAETLKAKDIEAGFERKRKERDAFKSSMEKATAEFQELEKQDSACNARIRLTKTAMEKEQKEVDMESKLIEKLRVDFEEITRSVLPGLEAEVGAAQAQYDVENQKLELLFESVHAVTQSLKSEKEALEITAGTLEVEHGKIAGEKKLLETERSVLLQKEKSGEELKAKTEKGVKRLEEQLEGRNKELEEALGVQQQFQEKLQEVQGKLQKVAREYELSLNQSTGAKQKLEQAKGALDSLTGGSGEGKNMIDRIMKESEKGKLKGVLGRLGDLGTVDPKYEIALAVALAGQAEAVVVDTTVNGQAVVDFVKSNRLGRVTCIILESCQPMNDSGLNQSIPRMVDMIKITGSHANELKKAFWSAMRDTLVAEDIETATRIGLSGAKRFRVVTTQGQVIEPSGAMTGGGATAALTASKNKRNLISQAEKDNERAQEEFEKSAAKFENVRNEKNSLVNERDSLERSLEHFAQIINNREEVDQLRTELEAEKARVASIVIPKLTAEEHEQVRVIGLKIEKIEESVKPLEKELEKLRVQIAELTRQIVAKAGEKTRKQKEIVDELSEQLETKKKELARLQLERNKVELKIGKAVRKIESGGEELIISREKLAKEEAELGEIEERAGAAMEEFTKARAEMDRTAKDLTELETQFNAFKSKIVEHKKKHAEVMNEIRKLESVKEDLEAKSKDLSKQISAIRKEYKALPHEIVELNQEERNDRVRRGLLSTEEMEVDMDGSGKALIADLTAEQVEKLSPPEVQTTLVRLEATMTKLHPNLKAIEDYRAKLKEYKHKVREMDLLCAKRDEVRKALDFLRQERLSMFMAGFNTITLKVKEMYQMLTLGGDAELELVDTTDPFAKGISFSVRPPKKTWKSITQLSGGEKTLSSLSLVFALHYFKPTPLYFLDEIDAALDTRNVAIIANYIKQRATNAQFIIISLRNQMFELADWLVGIYKTDHVSKSVTLDPAAASAGLSAFKPQEARPFYASPTKAA